MFLTCFWRHVNFAHFHRYFFNFPTKSCSKGLKKDLTISVTQLDLQRIDLFCHICTNFYHNFNFIWHKRPRVRVNKLQPDSRPTTEKHLWPSLNKYKQINQSSGWSVGLSTVFFCFDQSKRSSAVQQKHSQLESLRFDHSGSARSISR